MSASASAHPRRSGGWRRGQALALVLAVAPASSALAQVSYAGALRAATGTYLFTERTRSVYWLTAVEGEKGRVRVSASVPLIYQSTPWLSYGTVPVPSGGRQSGTVASQIRQAAGGGGAGSASRPGQALGAGAGGALTSVAAPAPASSRIVVTLPTETVTGRSGVGDPTLRASYRVTSAYAPTALRLYASYKPGLASVEQGFGTGASDYGAGASLAHLIGRHQLSGAVEAWSLGDMPDMTLNHTLSYRVAYDGYLPSNLWSVSGAFAGWTTIQDGVAPPMDISVGLARYFSGARRSIGATASFGLTDSSPDVMVSLDWRVQF